MFYNMDHSYLSWIFPLSSRKKREPSRFLSTSKRGSLVTVNYFLVSAFQDFDDEEIREEAVFRFRKINMRTLFGNKLSHRVLHGIKLSYRLQGSRTYELSSWCQLVQIKWLVSSLQQEAGMMTLLKDSPIHGKLQFVQLVDHLNIWLEFLQINQ